MKISENISYTSSGQKTEAMQEAANEYHVARELREKMKNPVNYSATSTDTFQSSNFYSKKKKNSYTKLYMATPSLIRLASANSKGQVHALIYKLRASIASASMSTQGNFKNQMDIVKMKGVIKKAEIKIVRLSREEKLKEQQILAKAAENRRHERELQEKLQKKIRARKAQERCQMLDTSDFKGKNSPYSPFEDNQYSELPASMTIEPGMTSYTALGTSSVVASDSAAPVADAVSEAIDVMA